MKVLMIYAESFGYKTTNKTLEDFPEAEEQRKIENSLIGFIHIEEKDLENISKSTTKLIKNLKWGAKKNSTKSIVLHSFAHLSTSKANPHQTKEIFDNAEKRLIEAGYVCAQTPFGYFLDLSVNAPGLSQARIFKEF